MTRKNILKELPPLQGNHSTQLGIVARALQEPLGGLVAYQSTAAPDANDAYGHSHPHKDSEFESFLQPGSIQLGKFFF